MKVLVYPHTMEIGGSQLNAIEMAAAVRDRGHDVAVISRPGALVEVVKQLGVTHIPLDPRSRRRPSPRAITQLAALARQRGIDVVHAYEWPPAFEAFAGPRLLLGTPVIATIYSGTVAPFLPRTIPVIVGADTNRRRTENAGRARVSVLEPPVDVRANAPGFDAGSFRSRLGLDVAVPLVAVVCRLVKEYKLEGLLAACDAVGELAASGVPVQMVIVGDGYERQAVEQAAQAANTRAGGRVVVLAGEMIDPRPAYSSADVMLGMGGSALRAMAFGKPLVVQGERGFWKLVTPESVPMFLNYAWYGLGPPSDGRQEGARRLEQILRLLLPDRAAWSRLGAYGRQVVTEHFSLDHAAEVLERTYLSAMQTSQRVPATRLAVDAGRSSVGVFRHQLRRKWQRHRGTIVIDDMNMIAEEDAQAISTPADELDHAG